MLLKELFFTNLMKTKIFEMAFHRKDVINKIDSISMPLAEHMVKVLYFDHHYQARPHWFGEINGYLKIVFRAQVKDAKPPRLPYETYTHLLWENPFGEGPIEIEWHLNRIFTEEQEYKNILKSNMTPEQIHKTLGYFYHDLCVDFSKDDYKGMNEYLKRYHII